VSRGSHTTARTIRRGHPSPRTPEASICRPSSLSRSDWSTSS
jgi:hypothetical protein